MFRTSTYALPLALLASATRSAAMCDGVVSTFTAECSYANFVDNLSADCSLDELFPPPDNATTTEEKIEELCAYGAPVRFGEIQGTYQRDRRYFAGGGQMVDGASPHLEKAPIVRFDANLADDTLIAFPEYATRVQYNINTLGGENATNGYPANMDLDNGCDLRTVMCCFTDGDFAAGGDATTDVCHHDLRDSPESSHIKGGWSAFPGDETSTHCAGFTWEDGGEELLGNMMYDVSLRNSAVKGYLKGVPGAPMCGCVEHMPVVEEAACRTASKTTEVTYRFDYAPATEEYEGFLGASNSVGVAYSDCAAGDLKAQFVANQGGDEAKAALIDEHLVGAGGCEEEVKGYLNDHFTVEGQSDRYDATDHAVWSDLVVGQGVYFQPEGIDDAAADLAFRALIDGGCADGDGAPRRCLVRRRCAGCTVTHTDVYYQRLTPLPTPEESHFLYLFMNQWVSAHNLLGVDFEMYSTYEDALAGENPWTSCNYDHVNVGFPRDCGPTGHVSSNWNSYVRGGGYADHHGFFVERPAAGGSDACQNAGNYPLYCTEAEANVVSPENSSHSHMMGSANTYMPNGVTMHHGDYAGNAVQCDCD